jgi:LmbE family N-acetylglucosaminyl deacetylase
MMKQALHAFVAVILFSAPCSLYSQGAPAEKPRVLWIAAHPDDEDTQMITWLSRSGRAEVAYLALNRGDGGQNLIGNELGEQLGIIRTEELLAARRIDGAHQYFTRAYDFGFSKTAAETYTHWPKDSILG